MASVTCPATLEIPCLIKVRRYKTYTLSQEPTLRGLAYQPTCSRIDVGRKVIRHDDRDARTF